MLVKKKKKNTVIHLVISFIRSVFVLRPGKLYTPIRISNDLVIDRSVVKKAIIYYYDIERFNDIRSSIAYSTNKNNPPNNDVVNIREKKPISDGSNCIKKYILQSFDVVQVIFFFSLHFYFYLLYIYVYIILE